MSFRVARVLLITAGCLIWLAGCASKLDSLWKSKAGEPPAASDTTGSVLGPHTPTKPDAALLGSDPNDDLSTGKKLFRAGAYGIAERSFRRAVEQQPRDAEAWLGLAACYDRLKRFDLADRAYAQLINIVGPTASVLNNQGFSYMLRGDYKRARATLRRARAKDPTNPFVRANLQLLEKSIRSGKAIEAD
jgi:Flp pilus assembly protein TadD